MPTDRNAPQIVEREEPSTDPLAKKKAEKEALLAAEEAALPSKPKSAPKAGSKPKNKETPVAKPGGLNNFSINDPLNLRSGRDDDKPIEEFGATGVEGMLEALEVANQKTDKQAMGAKVCYLSSILVIVIVIVIMGRSVRQN